MAARLVDECLEEARNAREVAAALDRFVEQVVEWAAEITGAISELFAIASVCGKLALAINSGRFSRMLYVIDGDLALALSSLSVSLVHIFQMFKRLGITPNLNGASYRRVWREMRFMFREEGSASLIGRLELYRTFLLELSFKLEGLPPGPCDMNILRSQIQMIYEYQQPVELMLGGLSLGRQGACMPQSTIPIRPRRLSAGGIQPRPATAPPAREWVGPYSPPPMPAAPEIPVVPLSPTSTHSSTSSGASTVSHWACRVFDGGYSESRLKSSGQSSKCLGLAMSTLGLNRHDMEVTDLTFDSDLNVRLVWNRRDNRAKILCSTGGSTGPPIFQSVQPLSALRITRAGPCLQVLRSGTVLLWANLKFKIYERMILFFCTFTALRAYGPADPMAEPSEFQLDGEIELYGGKIEDDGYLHALRLFRDVDSRAVRLQASVLNGEFGLKHTPIWTAFITKHVGSRSWLKRVRPKVIRLKDLRQYIFSHDYAPRRERGEFDLNFRSSQDAIEFENAFYRLP
ncbi:MAG: hypothetical protein M1813_003243 [Trichoglossum hirsutum]|nr:MAG: hypothetical protein M1813_003243 [Trichoglossum hirsutum]